MTEPDDRPIEHQVPAPAPEADAVMAEVVHAQPPVEVHEPAWVAEPALDAGPAHMPDAHGAHAASAPGPAEALAAEAGVPAEPGDDGRGLFRMSDDSRFLRTIIAVILLGVVMVSLGGIVVDYRSRVARSEAAAAAKDAKAAKEKAAKTAKAAKPSKPATSSAEATAAPKPPASSLLVLVEGVNFRERPSGSSRIITTLAKGTKLSILEQQGSWYHAKAPDGATGWLTSGSQYVKRQ